MRYRLSRECVARQAAAALVGSQSSVLIKETFSSWRQLVQELAREREVERLREEVLRYRVSKEGMARQAAAALVGSQASALMKETLNAWRQLVQELARERKFERLQEEVLRYRLSQELARERKFERLQE